MHTVTDMGQKVQEARKSAALTQQQLAARVGMRQAALSRFERGRGNDFSLARFLRLAQALGYNVALVSADRKPTLHDVLEERRRGVNVGPASR